MYAIRSYYDGTRIAHQLVDGTFGKITFITWRAGDHDTGSCRDDQRGNLWYQTVTDGQNGVSRGTGRNIQIKLEYADKKSADNVDQGDDDTGDGIAFDKFARTVHRNNFV